MIQSVVKTTFKAYINTRANQIVLGANPLPTTLPQDTLIYLAKFTNDMSGEVIYCYPNPQYVVDRFSRFQFNASVNPDMFAGQINITLAGYYHYEFYEVYYGNKPTVLDVNNSPKDENTVLPVSPDNGVVQGLVAIGKMYAGEVSNEEEVQYTEYQEPSNTNYIYTN